MEAKNGKMLKKSRITEKWKKEKKKFAYRWNVY